MDFLKNIFAKLKNLGGEAGGKNRTLYIVLAVVAVAAIIVAAVLLNQKSYAVLYSGLGAQEAGEMLAVLEEMGVDAKAQGTDTILVEAGAADEVRMDLAAQGYPSGGLDSDIFANASGLGTTDMEKNVYYQYQLQENIRKTLLKMSKIEEAVVNVNMQKESVFVLSNNQQPASAGVMLTLAKGAKLSNSEVKAIVELVASSVSGLKTENIRIVDSEMNLYTVNADEDQYGDTDSQLNLQLVVQKNLQEQVVALLAPVFGEEGVRAQVNVRLNFDKESRESIEFSPPAGGTEGLVTSLSELRETIADYDGTDSSVGTDPNGDTPTYPGVTDEESNAAYEKVSRDVTMQINQTKTLLESAQGTIEELSVAVVIDSAGLTADYTKSVENLVANAIGVSADKISVELLPFQGSASDGADFPAYNPQTYVDAQSKLWMSMAIVAGAVILTMFIILIVLQARNARLRSGAYAMQEAAAVGGIDLTADEDLMPGSKTPQIQYDQKDSTLAQVEEYIEKDPQAVAMLLRSWLSDD